MVHFSPIFQIEFSFWYFVENLFLIVEYFNPSEINMNLYIVLLLYYFLYISTCFQLSGLKFLNCFGLRFLGYTLNRFVDVSWNCFLFFNLKLNNSIYCVYILLNLFYDYTFRKIFVTLTWYLMVFREIFE